MIRGRSLLHHVCLPGAWALSLTLACTPTSKDVRAAAASTSVAPAPSATLAMSAAPATSAVPVETVTPPQGEIWLSCDKVVRRRSGKWERIGLPEDLQEAAAEFTLAHDGRVIVQVGNALLMSAPPSERVDAVVRRNPP